MQQYISLYIHVVVLDCEEQQPSQLGAREVHKTVKVTLLSSMKADLVGDFPRITGMNLLGSGKTMRVVHILQQADLVFSEVLLLSH